MNISMDIGSTASDFGSVFRTAKPQQSDFGEALAGGASGAPDEEERKKSIGIGFPNQLSAEEQHRVDTLKNQAMQIASQSDGEMTASQQAQVKAIEQQVSDITGMPMSENLVDKAKKVAEDTKKVTDQTKAEQEEALTASNQIDSQSFADLQGFGDQSGLGAEGQTGLQMLQQNALVTQIKSVDLGRSSLRNGL